jgi:phospholipase/lecithinase/hemolysin
VTAAAHPLLFLVCLFFQTRRNVMSSIKLRFYAALTMVLGFGVLAGGACTTAESDELSENDELNEDDGVKTAGLTPSPITQFTKVFIVGDSLSDTHRMGDGLIPYCPNSKRGYWNKRFSNGYLWIDYLMQDNPGLANKVSNYAVGGSGILKNYGSGIIGKTEKQAQDLVAQNPASTVSNSMVIIWAGANDIKEAAKTGSSSDFGHSIFNTLKTNTIEYLQNQGVDHFVLVGVPRIDLVPVAKSWSAGDKGWVAIAVNTLNTDLKNYAAQKGHVFVDVAAKIGTILNGSVTTVNLTDLSNPCWDGPNCVEQGDTAGRYTDQSCTGKMFFDRVHPTSGAHCGIAKWMEQAMSTQYIVSGGNDGLESCARRAQTEEAQWGQLPRNHSQPRPVVFKVQAQLNPSEFICQSQCYGAGEAQAEGTRGNITLPNNTTVGYCTCKAKETGWPLTFNSSGQIAGKACVQIKEPSDPDTWDDNYLCYKDAQGVTWSWAGSVAGMRCTQVNEGAEPASHTWNDNFLCVPNASPHQLSWSSAGPIAGKACVNFYEASDPDTWDDNYLCVDHGLQWSNAGPIAGKWCLQIKEPADPDTWNDNYLCANYDFGMKWSWAGPIAGMRCTQINEGSEPASHGWSDNYLCVPPASPLQFSWSMAGPIAGKTCVNFAEGADPHTWNDNYLCY